MKIGSKFWDLILITNARHVNNKMKIGSKFWDLILITNARHVNNKMKIGSKFWDLILIRLTLQNSFFFHLILLSYFIDFVSFRYMLFSYFTDFVVSFRWILFSYFTDFVSFRWISFSYFTDFVGFCFRFVSFPFFSFLSLPVPHAECVLNAVPHSSQLRLFRTFIIPRPYYDSSHWNYFRKSSMKEVIKIISFTNIRPMIIYSHS
jgi:hypothetical protein